MTTTTQPMTAEELLNMPDDGFRYELIRGQLRRYELNGHEQGRIAANAAVALDVYMKDSGLGGSCVAGTGFHLESHPYHVRAPHVASFGASEQRRWEMCLDSSPARLILQSR